jgi:hypothetical protein
MYDYDLNFVDSLLGDEVSKRKSQLVNYFAKLSFALQAEVFKIQLGIRERLIGEKGREFFRAKAPEFYYACFLLAIKRIYDFEQKLKRKSQWSDEEAIMASKFRIEKFKALKQKKERKTKVKNLIEVRFYELIKKLKFEENMSWRDIEKYLALNHKVKISYSAIRKNFLKIYYNEEKK